MSRVLAKAPSGDYPQSIELECAQVPSAFDVGSPVWLWLGSDNNKGQATEWKQGIRAIGRCARKDNLGGSQFSITLDHLVMLPRSVEKLELLQASPETYAESLSEAAIIGLNNYASQVVQLLTPTEFATIGAIIVRLFPKIKEEIFDRVPGVADIDLIERPASTQAKTPTVIAEELIEIGDDDPYYQAVLHSIDDDGMGGILLIGVPGTGKSWYARQIARKLTGGASHLIREIQFHSAYQYEDFVEGYVPDPTAGFKLVPKHFLQMVKVAEENQGFVVLIIDEFSRADPARVLGEVLTYMDGGMRGMPFYLPSGRKVSIPQNLIFIATMNPDDRSVDEIDDAMDRRWSKLTIEPSAKKVRDFLLKNGASGQFIAPTVKFFIELQKITPTGHALFRRVKDPSSLKRLWDNQLKYQMQKRFRFDAVGLSAVEGLWAECISAVEALTVQPDGVLGDNSALEVAGE